MLQLRRIGSGQEFHPVLIQLAMFRTDVPQTCTGTTNTMDPGFILQFLEQCLQLSSRESRKHLHQIPKTTAFFVIIGNVLHQKRLIGFPIQAPFPRISAFFADKFIELA